MMRFKQKWIFWKRQLLIFLFLYLGRPLLNAVIRTCTVKITGSEHFKNMALNDKCILMLWHNRIAPMEYILNRVAPPECTYGAVISNSRDGELLARIVTRYPQGRTIRIHHKAKFRGLLEMIQFLEVPRSVLLITPDGPKGPKYKIKPGIAMAAEAAGAKIVPCSWEGSSYWALNTWDQMRLPKPFSTLTVKFGEPIDLPQTLSVSERSVLLENQLLNLK